MKINNVPKTIEELKQWALSRNLPLDQMRTFIGENYKGAKAFGIYRDEKTGNFVVYKNKADGKRAVRYEGPDEAYAVKELYLKMKERVAQQKNAHAPQTGRGKGPAKNVSGRTMKRVFTIYAVTLAITLAISAIIIVAFLGVSGLLDSSTYSSDSHRNGYYSYGGNDYYQQDSLWYFYDYDIDDWQYETDVPSELADNAAEYYESSGYDYDASYSDFSSSDYYQPEKTLDNDNSQDTDWSGNWDDNSSWDTYDSWDTGIDNWDSDW